jgi:ATP synthase protein I
VPKENDRASLLRGIGPMMNLGVTFALSIGGLAYLGHWLDGRWDIEPWMTLLGAVLGMVIGFVNLFRVVLPPRKGGH